jgi:hypothetical protein
MILREVSQKIAVIIEAIGFVDGRLRISQADNNFAGFFCQHFGRIIGMETRKSVFLDPPGNK